MSETETSGKKKKSPPRLKSPVEHAERYLGKQAEYLTTTKIDGLTAEQQAKLADFFSGAQAVVKDWTQVLGGASEIHEKIAAMGSTRRMFGSMLTPEIVPQAPAGTETAGTEATTSTPAPASGTAEDQAVATSAAAALGV